MFNEKREIKISDDFTYICDNLTFDGAASTLCISPERLEQELIGVAHAFKNMFNTVLEFVKEIRSKVNRGLIYKNRKQIHKYDFSRPIIKHQVLDRKPKQLIKKIIH